LIGNSAITKTGDLVFKEIGLNGYTLTLNPAINSLTAQNINLPNDTNSSSNPVESSGLLLAEGVNVTLTKKLWLDSGKIEMGGGTLSLQQGGGLGTSGYGELDLINSTLELAGPFLNDGGTLTTSASTLRLKANVLFHLGNEVSFDTYEPNGWGLLLYNNEDASSTKSLTLGTNVTDTTLEPSADSLTSGFVSSYHSDNNIEYVSGSHDIGIEGNDTIFTINGNLTLRENATISTESLSVQNPAKYHLVI